MRLPAYIKLSRHGIFYFRLVIPATLRPIFGGRGEIRKSLATRDPKIAKDWAYTFGPIARAILKEAREMSGKFPKDFDIEKLQSDPSIRKLEVETPDGTKFRADPRIPGDVEALEEMVTRRYGLPNSKLNGQKRLDDAVAKVAQHTTAGAGVTPPQTVHVENPLRVVPAVARYYHECLSPKQNKKTIAKYHSALNEFAEHVGNVWVADLLDRDVVSFKDAQITKGLGTSTIDNKISVLSGFFKWARKRLSYPKIELPTVGQIELNKSEREKQAESYERFTLEELKKIFLSPTPPRKFGKSQYRTAEDRGAPTLAYLDENLAQPHWFWVPILALYTGARLEELCQLHITDIYRKDGILIADINSLDDKGVKSAAGTRHVPIHNAVVELGFLDYLADVREAIPDAVRLFPYLVPNSHDILSGAASKKFAAYLERVGVKTNRTKSFHSFRGTANQELTDKSVTLEYRCRLVGHDINNENVKSYQGDGVPVELLYKDGIARIRYERTEPDNTLTRLDLSPLKYTKGQFLEMLPELVVRRAKDANARQQRAAVAKEKSAAIMKQHTQRRTKVA
jgi:integrase